jgi:hypothetical protein
MRWLHTVGMVRWCRIRPDLKANLSGGVGFVRWCRIGLWDFPWDFLNGNRVGVRVGGPTQQFCHTSLAIDELSHLQLGRRIRSDLTWRE